MVPGGLFQFSPEGNLPGATKIVQGKSGGEIIRIMGPDQFHGGVRNMLSWLAMTKQTGAIAYKNGLIILDAIIKDMHFRP